MVRGLFGFARRKDERAQQPPQSPTPLDGDHDGWLEMVDGQVLVHDPVGEGRYATLVPDAGVTLWINGEPATEPSAVTSTDRLHVEVAKEQVTFFELVLSEDEMAVEMILTADPDKLPDTVHLDGRHQARLVLACSIRALIRSVPAKSLVLEQLRALGVEYGIDQQAIEAELAAKTGQPVTVARGQEPNAARPGVWVWRLNEWSLVEAGQVIALFQPGVPANPRVTVTERRVTVYPEVADPPALLPGNGTRLVGDDRLVASGTGRARAVSSPQGERVHIFPVHQIEGDLTGELDIQGDVIVHGSVRGGKISRAGEVYVAGSVEKSEISAETVTVVGDVVESQLYTIPLGHFVPLRADFTWVHARIEGMRAKMTNRRSVTREEFAAVAGFIRTAWRRGEQMGVNHADYGALFTDLARVFMEPNSPSVLDLPTAAQLLIAVGRVTKVAEKISSGSRDVKARSFKSTKVWAGRDVTVESEITASGIYCGGAIRTPNSAVVSRSELVAGGEVQVGVIGRPGEMRSLVRAGTRITAHHVESGTIFDFGGQRREFRQDREQVKAEVTGAGELVIQ